MCRLKIKLILILISAFYCCNFYAANKDSLFKVINSKRSHDTAKYDAYYELGWEYIYSNADSTYLFAQKALALSPKLRDKKNQTKVLNLFGAYFQIKGEFYQAIDYYQKALKIGEDHHDSNIMLIAYANIGALYITLRQMEKAKIYVLKSLTIAEKNHQENRLASLYNNLCAIELSLGNYKKCIEYGNKSLEYDKILKDKNRICSATGNIGSAYDGLNNSEKAIEYYFLCYKTAGEINNVYEEASALGDIGKMFLKKKNYNEAIKYFNNLKTICDSNEITSGLANAYNGLYECYKKLGNNEKALSNFELYRKVQEDVEKTSREQEVNKKEIEFQFNKQATADSIRNAEKSKYKDEILRANKSQIEKDKLLKIALTVGLLFFIGFGILIFNRFKITSRQKKIIEAKNKQTEEQKLIIEEKQKEILDSINYAKRIQDSLLDNFDSVNKFFADAFILLKPKDIVSGDFYWLSKKILKKKINPSESIVEELFFIAVCDSTGHGVPGGFMSLLNASYLSEAINERNIYEPGKIFDYVRDRLINTMSKNNQKDGFDGILMCFNKTFTFKDKELVNSVMKLTYAAAHNAPILVRNNAIIKLEKDIMPVGFGEKKENFTLFSYPIEKNDTIYIFTDGYADQFGGPKGKKFLLNKLIDSLLDISSHSFDKQSEDLTKKFEEWKGDLQQVDDVCLVGIKI